MPFSDEFDLDLVTSGNGIPGGNQPQSTSAEVTWAVSSLIIGSVLTGCTGDCVSSACSDNCSDNCTSTKTNAFCLGIILCNVSRSFDYLIYPYYPAYTS